MRTSQHRISLIEVVVALALLVIMALAMFSGMSMTMKTQGFTDERDMAREAARAKMEALQDLANQGQLAQVIALDGDSFPVPDTQDPGTNPEASYPTGFDTSDLERLVAPGGGDAGRIVIENTENPGASVPVIKVTIIITWRSVSSDTPNRYELASWITDRSSTGTP